MSCVYLKGATGQEQSTGRHIHKCDIHHECTQTGPATPWASCEQCGDKLDASSTALATKFVDHLEILDRRRHPTDALRDLLAGQSAFLVCGGPSAKALDLSMLERRGVFSLAVNNMAGFFKSSAFICADPLSKFHTGIWQDPRVMKFVPNPKLNENRGKLRVKSGDTFEQMKMHGRHASVLDMPNAWGFARRSWFQPDDTFFTENDAAWGNHNAGVKRTGLKKTVMTMLLAIRVLYYLGARRIYLVGVDFNMDPNAGVHDNYAFGQSRDSGAVASNNSQYKVVNEWLTQMVHNKTFVRYGLELFNCNPVSGLRAFPYVPFEYAVEGDVLKNYPQLPFDLDGWYEKK